MALMSLLLSLFLFVSLVKANDFQPYQLNGGLVSAVAGRNFSVTACDTRLMDGGYQIYTRYHVSSRLWTVESKKNVPVAFIASAGCNADCENLRRLVQMDARAFGATDVSQVAALLSQMLYLRRGFPFYSFCIVSGCNNEGGACYVYDAIGSFEQVAVASAGTGRELMQPILDRLFAGPNQDFAGGTSPKVGVLPKVVHTQVECTASQAVSRLIRAYRSVAERDIGVGDNLLIHVTELCDGKYKTQSQTAPLKRH